MWKKFNLFLFFQHARNKTQPVRHRQEGQSQKRAEQRSQLHANHSSAALKQRQRQQRKNHTASSIHARKSTQIVLPDPKSTRSQAAHIERYALHQRRRATARPSYVQWDTQQSRQQYQAAAEQTYTAGHSEEAIKVSI